MEVTSAIRLALESQRAGNLAQAEQLFKEILAEHPDNGQALHFLGVTYFLSHQYDAAITYIESALRVDPHNADAHNSLGMVLQEKGEIDRAIASYRNALDLNNTRDSVYYNLGNAFTQKGLFDDAICAYQKVVALNPNFVAALYRLGVLLSRRRQFDEALFHLRQALQLNPCHADTYNTIGSILQEKKQLDDAENAYRKALQLDPRSSMASNNLGSVLQEKGQLELAADSYRKAIEIDPHFSGAHCNLGTVYQEMGRIEDAIGSYGKAINLTTGSVDAHWNLSLALLTSGKFREGWKEYEWRRRKPDCFYYRRTLPGPAWDGRDLAGGTLLLTAEQGFGDTIQFIRYAPLLEHRGIRVIVECLEELAPLLRSIKRLHKVVVYGQQLPAFDAYCPLLSLPFFLDTTGETIPAEVPYLSVGTDSIRRWGERVHRHRAGLKVGIVWAGGFPAKKSCPLPMFSPLMEIPHVTFFSLQKGVAAAEAKMPLSGMHIIDHTEEIRDFSDTAALIENLDLVISVDTSVAHLAGALGKPVWTLLPYSADWRWLLHRNDSPWYPTMRLFRQPARGQWEAVIESVRSELALAIAV